MSGFLAQRTFAVMTARDDAGVLWTSPLQGPPGFLDGRGAQLRIGATAGPGDPLADLPADQAVGLLVIDFATRRRVRVNGDLTAAGPDGLTIDVSTSSPARRTTLRCRTGPG
jgi:hypothetical protein